MSMKIGDRANEILRYLDPSPESVNPKAMMADETRGISWNEAVELLERGDRRTAIKVLEKYERLALNKSSPKNLVRKVTGADPSQSNRYPDGQKIREGRTYYWPNGKKLYDRRTYWWPTGKKLYDRRTYWWPNGKKLYDRGTKWWPNGKKKSK